MAIKCHESNASSAAEMVTEIIQYLSGEPLLNAREAEALLAGIMLDTKDFVMRSGVSTFEAAAYLKKLGADTIAVKKLFDTSMENKSRRSAKTGTRYMAGKSSTAAMVMSHFTI